MSQPDWTTAATCPRCVLPALHLRHRLVAVRVQGLAEGLEADDPVAGERLLQMTGDQRHPFAQARRLAALRLRPRSPLHPSLAHPGPLPSPAKARSRLSATSRSSSAKARGAKRRSSSRLAAMALGHVALLGQSAEVG